VAVLDAVLAVFTRVVADVPATVPETSPLNTFTPGAAKEVPSMLARINPVAPTSANLESPCVTAENAVEVLADLDVQVVAGRGLVRTTPPAPTAINSEAPYVTSFRF
jgi:hypothetical protein